MSCSSDMVTTASPCIAHGQSTTYGLGDLAFVADFAIVTAALVCSFLAATAFGDGVRCPDDVRRGLGGGNVLPSSFRAAARARGAGAAVASFSTLT